MNYSTPDIYQVQNNFEFDQPEQVFINPVIVVKDRESIPVVQQQIIQQPIIQKQKSNLSIKGGIHGGSMKMTCENESQTVDLDTSPFIGADLMLNHTDKLEYGVGVQYEFNKNYNDLPVYGFLRYQLGNVNLTGALGYNFYLIKEPLDYVKVKNGMYYSLGLEGPVNSNVKVFGEYLSYTNDLEITLCRKYDINYVYNKFAVGLRIDL